MSLMALMGFHVIMNLDGNCGPYPLSMSAYDTNSSKAAGVPRAQQNPCWRDFFVSPSLQIQPAEDEALSLTLNQFSQGLI